MKLDQWAKVAEIIGAAAVVISLVYVGIQVNDSAVAARSAAANDVNVALQNWYIEIGSDEQTSELLYGGLMSDEALPDAQEFQFLMMTHAFFLALQNSYLLAEEGAIDQELRNSMSVTIGGINELPGMRRYWRQRKSYLHSGFVMWVEDLMAIGVEQTMDLYGSQNSELQDFATRYAAAWSGGDPAAFAAFYAEDATFQINDGEASVGRSAIEATARSFMTNFPDMVVNLVELRKVGDKVEFHWHWTGTNTGPGGTGNAVDLRGFEEWTFAEDGLILRTQGNMDDDEYQRQLHGDSQ